MSPSSLSRRLTQTFSILLGMTISLYILRGFGIVTFLPGGVILLLFFGAIAVLIFNYVQRNWWRF